VEELGGAGGHIEIWKVLPQVGVLKYDKADDCPGAVSPLLGLGQIQAYLQNEEMMNKKSYVQEPTREVEWASCLLYFCLFCFLR
jgi:hypothetical protein